MDAATVPPPPRNEPVRDYAPGSPERTELEKTLAECVGERTELTMTIDGEQRLGGGERIDVVQPHAHAQVLGTMGNATPADARAAVDAALRAAPAWRALAYDDRAAILLRAADLVAGPWRARMNAATMLGQSKTVVQAEIDAACELIDFWRYNVHFGQRLLADQPVSPPGAWNRTDVRPLEGFVLAITPFNFTAIAGNLPTAPALMGNTVVWKPAPTQQAAAHEIMRVLEAAGLPPGVINLVTGDGRAVSEVALADPHLAGVHFTGSTATFRHLWRTIGHNVDGYRSYPRIVGETGGKDFVLAHPSADPAVLKTALTRGAFEYQGQKCSAASRAYIARSVWTRLRDEFVAEVEGLRVGPVTDFTNFLGALIDARGFAKVTAAIDRAHGLDSARVIAGGTYDDSEGYFVRPTVVEGTDPTDELFATEYFGPLLALHVYDDGDWDTIVRRVDETSAYALTGAVIARDRAAIAQASAELRFAAGNLYVNDRPTGSIVGQQPFGGARGSGTNDKAGSMANLARWASPRVIKETFVAATDYRYPHMG